jgi:Family of unknown function (DUF6221)
VTLIEFLGAQLDEQHRVAEEMALIEGPSWSANPSSSEGTWEVVTGQREAVVHSDDDCCLDRDLAEWIAAWDPARVLAEIAAKRAILDAFEATYRESDDYPGWEGAMYCIAQPYAGREGWQPEWSVTP